MALAAVGVAVKPVAVALAVDVAATGATRPRVATAETSIRRRVIRMRAISSRPRFSADGPHYPFEPSTVRSDTGTFKARNGTVAGQAIG